MAAPNITQLVVSVVVPTYNRCASLKRLLDSLALQSYPASCFEVIVVDDGSTDGTLDFVRHCESPYQLRVFQQQHAGPATARNRGVAEATGELIVFLDDDVAPVPRLIEEHVLTHASRPDAVVIGPMSPPGDWPRPVWVRWEEEQLQRQYQAMIAGLWSCTARQFYTGNASLARARFVAAGGFDASFQRAEDVELGYRLHDRGATFLFNPKADVLHYASRSFESWCRTPLQYGRYDVAMHREGRQTLTWAIREFQHRNPLNRAAVRLLAGRGRAVCAAVALLGAVTHISARAGARSPALHALSAIFSLLYWQGICEEIGGRRALMALI